MALRSRLGQKSLAFMYLLPIGSILRNDTMCLSALSSDSLFFGQAVIWLLCVHISMSWPACETGARFLQCLESVSVWHCRILVHESMIKGAQNQLWNLYVIRNHCTITIEVAIFW